MSTYIIVVDDEPDVEHLFRQQFRRDIRNGRFCHGVCGVSARGIGAREDDR